MIEPNSTLKDFIKGYDIFETDDFINKYYQPLPTGYPELFFFLTHPTTNVFDTDIKRIFIGFDTKVIPVKTTSISTLKYISVLMHPHTALDVFGLMISDLSYNSSDVENAFGQDVEDFISGILSANNNQEKIMLFETKLQEIIESNAPKVDYILKEAVNEILERFEFSVEMLAKKFNCSTKTIQRRFKEKLGISPKDYMRIIRFNKAFRMIDGADGEIDYNTIIANCNYSNKWHFVEDFKHFTKQKTPEAVFSKKDYLILNRIYLKVE